MITIKEFANLCGCTTQTLRYYDQINLLKPFFVDENTGYRYYKKEQAFDFIKVKNLQLADLSIDEIKSLLHEDDSALFTVLEEKIELQRKKLEQISEIKDMYQDDKHLMSKLIARLSDLLINQIDESQYQKAINKLKITFNEDVINYDKYRPEYPKELYQDIINYSKLNEKSSIIEIGVGTGQATKPFVELGCKVVGIELGNQLSDFVKNKFEIYNNFCVINEDFMVVPVEENSIDLILSGTSFHWLPQKEGYSKIMQCLKPGGTIALFWNHPFPNRDSDLTNVASKGVYKKYRPFDQKQVEFSEEQCKIRVSALEEAGFVGVEYKLYHRVRQLKTDEYIHLLNTYSEHRILDNDIKIAFESDMKKAIDSAGGFINIYDTIDLYLAKKNNL